MKKLMLSMLAVAFVFAAATVVHSGMVSHDLTAIDSSGYTVVSITAPSHDIAVSQAETVSFDSNRLWLASDYSNVSASSGSSSMAKGMSSHGTLYCFDSYSKFCAVAF